MESRDPMADRQGDRSGRRISLQTLMIASLASAAASYAASRLWGAGTLVSAAATPVIVALVSEFLRRPVETVAATAKKVPTVYPLAARTGAAARDSGQAWEASRVAPGPTTTGQPRAPSGQPQPHRSVELPADNTPVADPDTPRHPDTPGHTDAPRWRPHWRLAVATGLVAFAIVVVLFTVPELLAGRSLTGNGQPTTFFGGSGSVKQKVSRTTTVTTTTSATSTPITTVTKSVSTTTTTKTTTASTPTTKTTGSASTPASTSTTSTTLPAASSTTTPGTPGP